MDIKKKITLQFISFFALILTISTLSIYLLFSTFRKEDFYGRLKNKAELVAQMLIDIDAIDTELLKQIEKANPTNLPKEKIVVFDENNEILFSSNDDSIIHSSTDLIEQTRQENQIRYLSEGYEVIGIKYSSRGQEIIVFAGAVDIFGLKKLKVLRNILITVFLSSLLAVYFAGRTFARRALRPIVKIIQQVDEIGIGNLDARLEEGKSEDEITQLSRTFNGMIQRMEEAFVLQKSFIANASHEMRIPLAAILGQIEVVLMQLRKPEEYQRTLESIFEDMKNLSKISNRLLMLAQASSEFAGADFSPVRLDDVLWQACAELSKHKKTYQVHIKFPKVITDEKQLTVQGNELLIITAIYNLLENGCKYSPDHVVNVELIVKDSRIDLIFKDNGIGIPKEEITNVLQPFYRASNSIHIKGHGIGLSLVDKIITLHQGKLKIESEENKGSTFILSFPILRA